MSVGISRSFSGSTVSNDSTINQSLSVHYSKTFNCVAVSTDGRFASLGGKKGLHIIDLDEPSEVTKTLNQQSKWEVSIVEWNPHPERALYIASTANQNTLIWNLEDSRMALQATLQTHQRAVSDLSWSLFDCNSLATCSADTYINLWDVRDAKRPIKMKSFCGWTAGATQVKWNRKNSNVLASSHNGEVRIWDIRKVSSPITFITAHFARIFSLDWSHTDEYELVTCSEDKQVKFWNSQMPRVCKATLQGGSPVLKARYTPFGNGLVTISQKSEYTLKLWSLEELNQPVFQYHGHTDVISAFDWRIKQMNNGKEFQLISWSKDQHLRLWHIDKQQQNSCTPSAITNNNGSISLAIKSKKNKEESNSTKTSASPIDKYGSHSPNHHYIIHDLAQEFVMLEKKKPKNVSIEEMNLGERYCIATVNDKESWKIKITFPSLYPHGAAPSFQFLPNTTLPTHIRAKVIENLSDIALFNVENNKACLYQCLCQLALLLRDVNEEVSLSSNIPLQSIGNMSSNNASNNNGNNNDSIPAPRTCSVAFGGVNELVYFMNFRYTSNSMRIRSFRDLKSHVQEINHQNITTLHEEPLTFSISSYFYSPQNYKGEMTVRQSNTSSNKKSTFMGNQSINTSLYIKKCSYLIPINYTLAQQYKIQGSIQTICTENAILAESQSRKDLVQLWNLIGMLMHPFVYNNNAFQQSPLLSIPWSSHPMVANLINSMLNHYELLKDIQTLAVISCILSLQPFNVDNNEIEEEQTSASTPRKINKSITKQNNNNLTQFNSLLDVQLKNKYDQYRNYYADILYRWGLLDKRNEVLKYTKQFHQPKADVNFSILCSKCSRQLSGDNNICINCKTYGFYCTFCHLPVKGMSSICLQCNHGGHIHHMTKWFATSSLCPTGCGCECRENYVANL